MEISSFLNMMFQYFFGTGCSFKLFRSNSDVLFLFLLSDIPEFLVEPSSKTVSEDSNVTLTCSVKPSSAVLYWRFEGEFLKEDNPYGFKVLGTELRIPSATLLERQESVFQCVVETSAGSILSKPATIYKAGKQGTRHALCFLVLKIG